jgi:hypothetical protein
LSVVAGLGPLVLDEVDDVDAGEEGGADGVWAGRTSSSRSVRPGDGDEDV